MHRPGSPGEGDAPGGSVAGDALRVSIRGLCKRYGAVVALDGARLDAQSGEVHAVVGENGAGKTTLLSSLAGLVRPDAGEIRIDGEGVDLVTPRQAWARGIGMVHQHFALVDRLSVLENLALGDRRGVGLRAGLRAGWRVGWRLDLEALRGRASELAHRVGLEVPLDGTVEALGVGDRQRAEILKVLLRDPSVLVLDEPTAVLAPTEVEGLLDLLRRLASEGRAVLLVAHKLDEVLSVADRVTVLRRGRTVLEAARAEVDAGRLARVMVGSAEGRPGAGGAAGARGSAGAGPATRRVHRAVVRGVGAVEGARPVARLRGIMLRADAFGARPALNEVDLEVGPGEVVGVAGVEGNGQRELARVVSGRVAPDRGTVVLPADPAFIPQDRRREALLGSGTLVRNFALRLQRDPAFRRGPFLRWSAIRSQTAAAMQMFGIRAESPSTRAFTLSGGNQQRVVVARELAGRPSLIVAENPTRGLDVAGAAFVRRTLREHAEGDPPAAVILISTDLDEILELSDRVVVMVRGRLEAVPDAERTREGIGARMLTTGAGPAGQDEREEPPGTPRDS